MLLLVTLFWVGESVTAAEWVETPGLISILMYSAVAGLLLSKVRAPAPVLHLVGLALGVVVVVWQTSSLIEGQPLIEQVRELWNRLEVWYNAATSGGISRDLLPFTLTLLTMAWVLGYVSSWFLFRSSNVWVGVVIAGIAILTNLSFLPSNFAYRFFVFAFFAMLLVVRMGIIHRHEYWRNVGIRFGIFTGWLTLNSAVWFSAAVLILAAFLPMRVFVSAPLADAYKAGRSPVAGLEDHFARLFSGVPSRKNLHGRFFGDTLPFQGKISFGGEVVFWADSDYPSYWLSQTYSEYTPRGWIAGDRRELKTGPDTLTPPSGDLLKRVPVEQSVQMNFSSKNFLSGGGLEWVSREAVLEALAPMEFEIDLPNPSKDASLPEDIQELATELRENVGPSVEGFVESDITKFLPSDLVLMQVTRYARGEDQDLLKTVTLARKEPVTPEVVSWRFKEKVPEEGAYFMTSHVSIASNDELREAGEEYDGFIRDHYMQLPPELAQRVRDLAERVAQGAETPLDKALAMQSYLRGPDFTYSQDIDAPPLNADGVEHFLLETRTGYSDYFASSMAVLLRAVGVPTRMAAGYAPGEYDDESGLRFVRDSDSHGWVQVYFPGYGWIDFEPTPEWPAHERGLRSQASMELPSTGIGGGGPDLLDELPDTFEDDLTQPPFPAGLQASSSWDPMSVVVPAAWTLGAVGSAWLIFQLLWTASLSRATPVERAYTKMSRLGALAGIRRSRHETPVEYGQALGRTDAGIAPAAHRIAWAFAGDRYGRQQLGDEDEQQLDDSWKSMRRSLIARALGRLVPRPMAQRR